MLNNLRSGQAEARLVRLHLMRCQNQGQVANARDLPFFACSGGLQCLQKDICEALCSRVCFGEASGGPPQFHRHGT